MAFAASAGIAAVSAGAFAATEVGMAAIASAAVGGAVAESLITSAAGEFLGDTPLAASASEEIAAGAQAGSEVSGGGPAAQTAEEAVSKTKELADQIIENPDTGSGASVEQTAKAEQAFTQGAKEVAAAQPPRGIIDRAMDWIEKNPTAATIAGTQIAGAVGGAGKAALEKEIQKRNIQARKDLLVRESEQKLAQSREGVANPAMPAPSGRKVLRRSDGTLVYVPNTGIVNNSIPTT